MTISVNAYLTGNWRPVQTEASISDLTIVGKLPDGLSGMFVRNGPNPQFPPLGDYHWFDGDGMLHAVVIGDGKARYLNRFVQTRGYQIEREAGQAIWMGLLEPPQRDLPDQSRFVRGKKNAANTALVWHARKLFAVWDTGEPYRISVEDLQTLGPYDFDGKLEFPIASHPKIDPVTHEMMVFGGTVRRDAALSYGVISSDGRLVHKVDIPIRSSMYAHDFAITEHYSILMDTPFEFDMAGLQARGTPYHFRNDRSCRFAVIPRFGSASDVRWFETSACFLPHTLNAYEAGDEIVLLGDRVTEVSIGPEQSKGGAFYTEAPTLYRWRFNLKTGITIEEKLDDQPIEFTFAADSVTGRRNRYGYASRLAKTGYMADAIVKYDFDSGTHQIAEHGPDRFGGVVVFVPRKDSRAEDDGWLLGYVHDEGANVSDLTILDAQDLAAGPLARIIIPSPHRVPYGVHGIWLDDDQISQAAAD